MKSRWFKFYFFYREAFQEVSLFQCRKLILAIIDYQEKGFTEIKLNKKTSVIFKSFTDFINAEREINKKNGLKGSKNRWSKPKNGQSISKK